VRDGQDFPAPRDTEQTAEPAAGHALTDGPILTLPDRVQAHLVDAIQQQFDALVLESATTSRRTGA
jgi:hypothetical protein